jgi:hypothetical protein
MPVLICVQHVEQLSDRLQLFGRQVLRYHLTNEHIIQQTYAHEHP